MSELLELAIDQKQIPRYLYKYTTIENAIKAIEGGTVYFARFAEFNDEYESYAQLDTTNDIKDWANFLVSNGIYGHYADFLIKTVLSNPDKAGNIIRKVIEESQSNNGFLCLSTKPNNVLMWAHYAEENKGCCLEYDLLADPEVFSHISKIQYDDNTIIYNYLKYKGGPTDSMFHKSKQWEYEDEYRVVWIGQHGVRKVKDNCLTRIIFGPKTSDESTAKVKELLSTKKGSPRISKAVKGTNPKEFEIHEL